MLCKQKGKAEQGEGGALAPQSRTAGDTKTLCWHMWEGAGGLPCWWLPACSPPLGPCPVSWDVGEVYRAPGVLSCVPGCCGPGVLWSKVGVKCWKCPLHGHEHLPKGRKQQGDRTPEHLYPGVQAKPPYSALLGAGGQELWGWSCSVCCSTHRLERQ